MYVYSFILIASTTYNDVKKGTGTQLFGNAREDMTEASLSFVRFFLLIFITMY
jgi:hypothetical protein